MRKVALFILTLWVASPLLAQEAASPEGEIGPPKKTSIGAYKVSRNRPTRRDVVKDSKPRNISFIDILFLSPESVLLGHAKVEILVGRLTGKVEYIWSPPYNRYVKPKFVFPTIQSLYDRHR